MRAFVVDTNVAVAANGKAIPQADIKCQLECVKQLEEINRGKVRVCIDSGDYILAEYRKHLSPSGEPGVGDAFMQWIDSNQTNSEKCERVLISEHSKRGFKEFPDDPRLEKFDLDDRKFVSVALESKHNPFILNAVDRDWSDFQEPLSDYGVKVMELCPQCIKRRRKT